MGCLCDYTSSHILRTGRHALRITVGDARDPSDDRYFLESVPSMDCSYSYRNCYRTPIPAHLLTFQCLASSLVDTRLDLYSYPTVCRRFLSGRKNDWGICGCRLLVYTARGNPFFPRPHDNFLAWRDHLFLVALPSSSLDQSCPATSFAPKARTGAVHDN